MNKEGVAKPPPHPRRGGPRSVGGGSSGPPRCARRRQALIHEPGLAGRHSGQAVSHFKLAAGQSVAVSCWTVRELGRRGAYPRTPASTRRQPGTAMVVKWRRPPSLRQPHLSQARGTRCMTTGTNFEVSLPTTARDGHCCVVDSGLDGAKRQAAAHVEQQNAAGQRGDRQARSLPIKQPAGAGT